MTVLDFVRLVRTSIPTLVASTLAGLLLAFAYTSTLPEIYTATATGYVTAGSGESVGDVMSSATISTAKVEAYAPLVNTRGVGERIVEELGVQDDPGAVAGSLTAVPNGAAQLLGVQASAGTPAEARDRANAAIKAVAEEAAKLETGGREGVQPAVRIQPMESAQLPGAPSSPNVRRNLLAGAVVGLLLGLGWSALRRRLDARIRISKEAEELTKSSVIGVIPESTSLAKSRTHQLDRHSAPVEAMRHVRTNLRFVDVDKPPRSIVITSANKAEGKSTISSTLARMLAEAGQPVVLVDADLRRPNVANFFGLEDSVGLTQVLAGDVALDDVLQETTYPGLSILSAGRVPPNPSELLGSRRMHALIERLSEDHFVILDAPPLLPVTDAGLLATQTDGAVLVLQIGKTYKEQAALCAKIFDQVGGRLLGVVLNRAPAKSMGTVVYGYGYGYGSYQSGYGEGYGTPTKKRWLRARKERREREQARKRGTSRADRKRERHLTQRASRAEERASRAAEAARNARAEAERADIKH